MPWWAWLLVVLALMFIGLSAVVRRMNREAVDDMLDAQKGSRTL